MRVGPPDAASPARAGVVRAGAGDRRRHRALRALHAAGGAGARQLRALLPGAGAVDARGVRHALRAGDALPPPAGRARAVHDRDALSAVHAGDRSADRPLRAVGVRHGADARRVAARAVHRLPASPTRSSPGWRCGTGGAISAACSSWRWRSSSSYQASVLTFHRFGFWQAFGPWFLSLPLS